MSGYYVPEYDEEDVDDDDDEEDDYLDPEMMDEEELAEMYGLGSDSDEDEEDGEERRLIPASRVKIEVRGGVWGRDGVVWGGWGVS